MPDTDQKLGQIAYKQNEMLGVQPSNPTNVSWCPCRPFREQPSQQLSSHNSSVAPFYGQALIACIVETLLLVTV